MLIHVPPHVRVLAMDVHANTISIGLLEPGSDSPVLDKVSADDESVRRLIARFDEPARVWACYEAGPTGYELARVLRASGVRCEVIAPSLIPARPGDRVKTDRRDARRLALLFRSGQLSSVRVPSPAEEAVRDLCRARADMVIDRTRARHRLGKFLLRHGRVWRGGDNWTLKHQAWLRQQRFEERALNETLAHYQATLSAREAAVEAIDADLAAWYDRAPFADAVHRLAAYRGVTELGGLTLASEVCDWRRFPPRGCSWPSPGSCPARTPAGNAPVAAASPTPATGTCGPSSSRPPGPTRPRPRSVPPSAGARRASTPPWSPGRGPPRCACAASSAGSTPARATAR
ncbi:MAG: transposase, partial [Actinomycetota bacterium]|nr:transposase [Actinomycetota bacterium]